MDADGDGKVTPAELKNWISHVSQKSAQRHAHLKWTDLLADARRAESPAVDTITWELYKAALITKGIQFTFNFCRYPFSYFTSHSLFVPERTSHLDETINSRTQL